MGKLGAIVLAAALVGYAGLRAHRPSVEKAEAEVSRQETALSDSQRRLPDLRELVKAQLRAEDAGDAKLAAAARRALDLGKDQIVDVKRAENKLHAAETLLRRERLVDKALEVAAAACLLAGAALVIRSGM